MERDKSISHAQVEENLRLTVAAHQTKKETREIAEALRKLLLKMHQKAS